MRTMYLFLSIFMVAFLTNTVRANDGDSTKIEKKIIKTIVVNDDGRTVTDSTFVYEGDALKVFVNTNSDCLPDGKAMRHRIITAPHGKAMMWTDSDEKNFDITVDTDGDSSRVIIMKGPEGMVKEFRFKNDEMDMPHMMMLGNEDFEHPLQIKKEIRQSKSKLIDLNDPAIISFEKETLKNGNEKITIVRQAKK